MGSGRRYSGLDAEERTTQRRAAILAAALELFGTTGYAATSVKQICREAGLTERYFYESFRDREASLTALYTELTGQMRDATLKAVGDALPGPDGDASAAGHTGTSVPADLAEATRSGLAAFIGFLAEDPRRARVVLIEVVGVSPGLEDRRHAVLREFAGLVSDVWSAEPGGPATTETQRLTTVGLVGAVNHLLVNWLMEGRHQAPSVLVDVCATLFTAARERLW